MLPIRGPGCAFHFTIYFKVPMFQSPVTHLPQLYKSQQKQVLVLILSLQEPSCWGEQTACVNTEEQVLVIAVLSTLFF